MLHPIKNIFHVECADGNNQSYSRYIEGNITTQIEPSLEESYPCVLLVVQESNYNRDVPILLGTNILQHLLENVQEKFGSKCLQEKQISAPWKLSFKSLLLKEKELQKNNNRLGIVKSAHQHCITIRPNSSVTLQGYVDKVLPYHATCALLQATSRSRIPTDLDIVPSLVNFKYP